MDTNTKVEGRATPWNKGKLLGQKPPLKLKEIWAIRIRLQLAKRTRKLAFFNLAIDSKLRGCDLVGLRVHDVVQVRCRRTPLDRDRHIRRSWSGHFQSSDLPESRHADDRSQSTAAIGRRPLEGTHSPKQRLHHRRAPAGPFGRVAAVLERRRGHVGRHDAGHGPERLNDLAAADLPLQLGTGAVNDDLAVR
jgi:hypothetical protein